MIQFCANWKNAWWFLGDSEEPKAGERRFHESFMSQICWRIGLRHLNNRRAKAWGLESKSGLGFQSKMEMYLAPVALRAKRNATSAYYRFNSARCSKCMRLVAFEVSFSTQTRSIHSLQTFAAALYSSIVRFNLGDQSRFIEQPQIQI